MSTLMMPCTIIIFLSFLVICETSCVMISTDENDASCTRSVLLPCYKLPGLTSSEVT